MTRSGRSSRPRSTMTRLHTIRSRAGHAASRSIAVRAARRSRSCRPMRPDHWSLTADVPGEPLLGRSRARLRSAYVAAFLVAPRPALADRHLADDRVTLGKGMSSAVTGLRFTAADMSACCACPQIERAAALLALLARRARRLGWIVWAHGSAGGRRLSEEVHRPSSERIVLSPSTTFDMCASSETPSSAAPFSS